MAKTAVKIRAIALTALQETLRRRVLYVAVILVVLLVAVIGSGMALLRMAVVAGEAQTAESMRASFVQTILGVWQVAAAFLAVFLGAVGISSEVTAKTIVNVLSRPVDRAVYLTGRWLGTVIFLWAFTLFGILLALAVSRIFDVHFIPTLWVGFVEMFVTVTFLSGVSLGLSVFMPPILAGAGTIFIDALPEFLGKATSHPNWIWRSLAKAGYYLAPSNMPADLIGESFTKELLHPNYALYAQVLAENLLYAIAVFVVASAIFARRELQLR